MTTMTTDLELSTTERLLRLLQHLGIARAHLAGSAAQLVELADAHPAVVASLVLPRADPRPRLRPELWPAVAPRMLFIYGETGPFASAVPPVLPAFPGATTLMLRDYVDIMWGDMVADRRDEIGPAMLTFLDDVSTREGITPLQLAAHEGIVAGITYQLQGSGPPLLLFPIGLAPSQWDPLLPALAARYCTITLGGAFLGTVRDLEERVRRGYLAVVRGLFEAAAVAPGETVLEVGCGPGTLVRWLAHHTAGANPILGVDLSRFLLRQAAALARQEGVADRIAFQEGNAEALPLPDASVDVAVACTVLEEGDADQMLAKLVRVTRPGGRVGVIVRANDLPRWINLPLRPAVLAKAAAVPMAGVGPQGCADASLYRRFRAAGLTHLTMGPQWATNQPVAGRDDWRAMFDMGFVAALTVEEADEWRVAMAQADAEGTYLWADPYHCAVGTKP